MDRMVWDPDRDAGRVDLARDLVDLARDLVDLLDPDRDLVVRQNRPMASRSVFS